MSNRAWVTLATNDSYGLGALVLANSLRRVNSAYPAVVLITPSVTEPMRERLRAVYAEVVIVDVLDSGDAAHLALLQRPELGITFTKIHCWNLTQYEKCVFLDADTLIVQNCDELFEREQLSAAPDVGWPDCFNSGVFVFTPSADTFSQLISFAQERGSFDGGDQGLLNSFFSDWARGDINKHLPFLYNVTSAAFYSYLPALKHFGQDLKIIHFIGAAKPWLQQFNFESGTIDAPEHIRGLLQLWWDIFVSQVHCQLDTSMVEVEECPEVPAIPPQDVSREYHYQPILDPQSEFAWHHPDSQKPKEPQVKRIDATEFFDPWDIYKGLIPANPDYDSSYSTGLVRVDNQEEIRKYVWDYQAQKHSHHDIQQTHGNYQLWQQDHQNHYSNHHWQCYPQQNSYQIPHTDHPSQQYILQYDNQTYDTDHHWQRIQQGNNDNTHNTDNQLEQHTEPQHNHTRHWEKYSHHHNNHTQHTEHCQQITQHDDHSCQQHHIQQNDNQIKDSDNIWQNLTQQNYNDGHNNCQQRHNHNSQSDVQWQYNTQDQNNQIHHTNIWQHNNSQHQQQLQHHHDDNNRHEHHTNDHNTHSQHNCEEHQRDGSSHTHTYKDNNFIDKQYHTEHAEYTHKTHIISENVSVQNVQIETVKKHNRRKRRPHPIDVNDHGVTVMNGDVSDNESDDYEEIIPRHPYDGFYLRHRATIDARGRKICSHEIPPTPSPSPPLESSLQLNVSKDNNNEYLSTNGVEFHSGVAGNLARVLPGAAGQREALDELTRRQGWEAGNIDYMGADSFDNIWAKISQTLSQPRSSPPKQQSPPKEITVSQPVPEQIEVQCGEVSAAPISEQVEVAKEAIPVESVVPLEKAPVQVETVASANVDVTVDKIASASLQETPAATETLLSAPAVVPVEPEPPAELPTALVTPVEVGCIEIPATIEPSAVVKEVEPIESAPIACPTIINTTGAVGEVAPVELPIATEAPTAVQVVTSFESAPIENVATTETPTAVEVVPSIEAAATMETAATPAPLGAADVVTAVDNAPADTSATIEASAPTEAVPPVEAAAVVTAVNIDVPATVEAVASVTDITVEDPAATKTANVAEIPPPNSIPPTVESCETVVPTTLEAAASEAHIESEKVTKVEPVLPQAEPVEILEQPEEKTETPVVKETATVPDKEQASSETTLEAPTETTPTSADVPTEKPAVAVALETTPEKQTIEADTDSPPLVNTPSKEEVIDVSAVKSEERRKPAGKLKLVPPAVADPLPTPDSELEDAAALAQSIIASELRTPTVTSPEPAATPASPPLASTLTEKLAVEEPLVPTPPVGAVSLAQIGVKTTPKGKSTTAAQIESSVVETPPSEAAQTPTSTSTPPTEELTPSAAPAAETPALSAAPVTADVPKKKIVKKIVKKEAGASGVDAPVPPPRKKEKKPKEK